MRVILNLVQDLKTMDTNNEVLELLKKVGAVITDSHFVYTSGQHGDAYINKDALYPHTKEVSRIGELFAEKNKDKEIDIVAAPALGGIILETWTAYHLSNIKGKEILGVYTEKTPDKNQIFTRGYDQLVTGKNVLVIEDLANTGGSVKKVVDSVKAIGGNVIAVSVMVNRNPLEVTSDTVGAPLEALSEIQMNTYAEADCPLCKNNVPINTTVGHGKKFVEMKNQMAMS
ncbi:MAG TPA: phosphoribosyltransferase family protein [Candidatus Saccharimonadales bacterium]|nr:phosphoribosyltransferase family protein [Candidatus Saccharimonadales bacterium]